MTTPAARRGESSKKIARSSGRSSSSVGICILAGGLSSRMGRNKSSLRLGATTILQRIRRTAVILGLPIRVIRRDVVPRCGPLGGIYTGLITSRHEAELFLASDMPFIEGSLLQRLIKAFQKSARPVFVRIGGRRGFPCLLPAKAAPLIRRSIESKKWSIQELASALRAPALAGPSSQLFNINTPADLTLARNRLRREKSLSRCL